MKNKNMSKILLALVLGGAVVAGAWAWSEREPDTLGEHIDKTVDDVTDQVDDAADAIGDGLDDVKDKLEDAGE